MNRDQNSRILIKLGRGLAWVGLTALLVYVMYYFYRSGMP